MNKFKEFYYKIIFKLISYCYFRKIIKDDNFIIDNNPKQIFALSHRNGAVDGWVYGSIFSNLIFILAKQLQKNIFLKLLFPGIAIFRKKDAPDTYKQANIKAFKESIKILDKKILGIFPEGTSSLGIKHLAFENGLSKIATSYIKQNNKTIKIIPFAIFYDDPTAMGGKVFIKKGKSFEPTNPNSEEIHNQLTENFEEILLEYPNQEEMINSHKIAIIATLFDENKFYPDILFKLKNKVELFKLLNFYQEKLKDKNLFNYKKVLIYPKNILLSLWTLLITSIIVLPSLIFNLIPLSCGFLAGLKAKEENVISLFRIIVGFWIGIFYYLFLLVLAIFIWGFGGFLLIIFTFLFSLWGFNLYGAFKKHLIALSNLIKFPQGRADFLRLVNETSKFF